MQKKIIALAVSGLLSGAAMAQSNVTIYGNIDAGYRHASGSGLTSNGIDASNWTTSRLGFKGTEDLGNGMKAVFLLEYPLSNDLNAPIGGSSFAARQQYVGLTGDFGSIVAGRLQPMAKPGLFREMDQEYRHRFEVVEFTVKHDDGQDPRGLQQADVILVGVSRTSKTPLSMFLAGRGLRVANIPVVHNLPLPEEIHRIDGRKVVGLTIFA